MQTKQKHFLVANTEYGLLLNNSATERNIEMQEVIICLFSWSVFVLNSLLKKVIDILL